MPSVTCPWPGCTFATPEDADYAAAVGHLQLHREAVHATAAAPPAIMEKPKRPTIAPRGTAEEWTYFTQRWAEYKAASRISGTDVIYQLLDCCTEELRRDISRTYNTLSSTLDESTVLDHIKALAIRKENVLVARVEIHRLQQDRDEPVRAFAARLRGQASICNFSIKCPCSPPVKVDYSDTMVRDALVRGLYDEEIRLDLLSKADEDITLEDALKFVEAKESGKRSASRLAEGDSMSTTAATSSYRRRQRYRDKPRDVTVNQPQLCGYCGKPAHGSDRERPKLCPAYGKTCSRCGIKHHFQTVCRQPAWRLQ